MNGTDMNTESGKLLKTLYMNLNDFLIIKDGLLMHQKENPGIFVTYIKTGHIYNVLIETLDFKTKTIRNKKYTVSNQKVCGKHIYVDIHIKDFTEHMDVNTYSGDYTILRILAEGTDPSLRRTIRIVDVTEEAQSDQHAGNPDDKIIELSEVTDEQQGCISEDDKQKVMLSPFQKSVLRDISSPKSSESNNNDTETMEETRDTKDTDEPAEDHNNDGLKQDIENLLHDVDALEGKLINIIERSAVIKHYVETHATSISDHILQNEVCLLNTYLSSIAMMYGNNLDRVSQNIKDTLEL